MYILLMILILLIAADFGSRSRQSSAKMSRESSAGEPKVPPVLQCVHVVIFCALALTLSLCLCLVTKQTIYSLKELQVSNGMRLPRDVNRMKLEVCTHSKQN